MTGVLASLPIDRSADPLNGQGHHVTVLMAWHPKVDTNRFLSIPVAGLCHCAYMFTESLFEGPLTAPNILGSLDLGTLP